MNHYIFPFQMVKKDSKIILYGAGTVGRRFYSQLEVTGYAEVVLWADKNFKEMQRQSLPVKAPEEILHVKQYDYVVIAIDNEQVAAGVKETLVADYGVSTETIVFSDKYRIVEEETKKTVFEESYDDSIKQIMPKELLSAKRLDLAVRYLVAKDIKNDIKNEANLSLYSRMILARTGAREGESYFSEYKREGTEEFIAAMRDLCQNMKDRGFDREKFIPVGDNGIFLNGAHRTAAALALEEKIWVKYFHGQNGNEDFGMEWFEKNGFSEEDKIRILRAYADLYEKCGIMLLFGPCMGQWEYLQRQLEKQMTVVGAVELDFTDNYIAFENLLREIYSDPLWRNVYIDRKAELLKMAPLKIRVLLLSDEGFTDTNLYETMKTAKLELRDRMYFETDIAPVVMHGSDSAEEFLHLKKVLLSANNLKHLRMRVARNYSEEFIGRMERLKQLLKERGIHQNDVCITEGGGFEIFGLRKSRDLDFMVKSDVRAKYGDVKVYWTDEIEYVRKNALQISEEIDYADDLLIEDDNLHYIFNGLKCVNLSIVCRKKAYVGREKDIRDVRLYEQLLDYAKNFDDKALLKKKIENEFYRKR